jgi:hypothetical protein
MKKLSILFLASLAFFSCQKEVSIELPEAEKKIVVDGGIFTGQPAELNLTWSTGYFDPIDSASLANYLITNAVVTLTDGLQTDTLHLAFDPTRPIPIVWKGANILGQPGGTYVLNVTAEGKSVTSTTTIPQPVPLDSTWFKTDPGQDSLGFAWAHLTDPVGYGNAYRWFAKRASDQAFYAPFGSTFDDRFFEGASFDFAYNRPSTGTSADENDPNRGYYKIGDTIIVRFCAIGKAESDFFRTYETEVSNNGNPFASPGVVKTNVENGLGIFCGYSPAYDTIICQ